MPVPITHPWQPFFRSYSVSYATRRRKRYQETRELHVITQLLPPPALLGVRARSLIGSRDRRLPLGFGSARRTFAVSENA